MNEIIKPFKESLFDISNLELTGDIMESGLDLFIENCPLEGVPFFDIAIKSGKFLYNLHDRNLLKETLIFIKEFNNRSIDPDKLRKYKLSLENDANKAEKELGRVLMILNRIIDIEKSIILSRLYAAYINEEITWDKFREMSDVNDRLFVSDLDIILDKYANSEGINMDKISNFQRLVSVGLLKHDSRFDSKHDGGILIADDPYDAVELTPLAVNFCELVSR